MADENVSKTEAEIKLLWPLENDLPTVYANHAQIVATPNEVTLVFGAFLPTGMHNRGEQDINEFLNSATVQPVAKIAMTKEGFKTVYQMIERHAKRLEKDND